MRAAHVTELRACINALRAQRGVAAATWTDATITPGVTPAKTAHITDLRSALAAVYTAAGASPPGYTDPTLSAGTTPLKAVHIGELRAATTAVPLPPPTIQTFYYHTDQIGSVRAITNAAAQTVGRYDFDPYGNELQPAATFRDPRLFAGGERDPETALDYFGARYYGAHLGRFLNPDDPVFGDPFDPQSTNQYTYARNSPLSLVDPTGTEYEICAYGVQGLATSCGSVSDQYFAQLERNPGAGLRLWGGFIYAADAVVGYYRQLSVDPTLDGFIRLTGDLSSRWLREQSTQMAVGAAIAATGGLAAGAFSGGIATSEVLGIGRIAVRVQPSPGQIAQMQQVFARQGRAGVEKALRSLERRLAEHVSKIDAARGAGGHTSSMEREVANFRQLIAAARQILRK